MPSSSSRPFAGGAATPGNPRTLSMNTHRKVAIAQPTCTAYTDLLPTVASRSVYAVQVGCAIATFLCVFMLSVRGLPGVAAPPAKGRELLEGIRFVAHDPLILPAISLDLFGVLFGG